VIPPEIVAPPRSRLRIGVGAAVILVLLALGVSVVVAATGSHGDTIPITAPTPVGTATGTTDDIYVHLLGQVVRPGLYVLHDGDRAVDAVAAAGGFTATADRTQLNLARPLVDGEQIVVPAVGEAPAASGSVAAGTTGEGGRVNLNSADETALETLPRVGPALAGRILDWRKKNGRFTSVEDLMSVTGIGQKTFDGLKDLVTV
jgi:competence protein ComEA